MVIEDVAVVVWKELVQISNRRRFHLEKVVLAVAAAVTVCTMALIEVGPSPAVMSRAASFGRSVFLYLMMGTAALLSLVALAGASGIILSERLGGRLELLRATPLSLRCIVTGKALAILARCFLVLLVVLPVVAAVQLFGGVSADDLAKAFLLATVDIFACMALGLFISSGSTSMLDRGVKLFEVLAVVGVFFWMIDANYSPSPSFAGRLSFLSHSAVWEMLGDAKLPWRVVLANVTCYGFAGSVLLVLSNLVVERHAARETAGEEAPRVGGVVGGFKEVARRSGPRRDSAVAAGAAAVTRRLAGLKRLITGRAEWLGGLLAVEMKRSSVLLLAIPPATVLPVVVFMVAGYVKDGRFGIAAMDTVHIGLELFAASILVAVALQACGMIAGERSRRTLAALALTKVGGVEMLFWKGAAIFVSQSLWIITCLAWVVLAGFLRAATPGRIFINLFAFLAALILAYSVGSAFSLCARTPFSAVGFFAGTAFALAPLLMMVLTTYWDDSTYVRIMGRQYPPSMIPCVIVGLGAVAAIFRQFIPRISGYVLMMAFSMAAVGGVYAMGLYEASWEHAFLPIDLFLFLVQPTSQATLAWGVLKLALSVLMLVGMFFNFDAMVTREDAIKR